MRATLPLVLGLLLGCSPGGPEVIDYSTDTIEEPVCAPATKACAADGNALLICQDDGEAFVSVPCPAGCVDAACVVEACTPNTNRCLEPKLAEHCGADGQSTLIVCDHGCLNGECTDIVCTAGKSFCEPDGDKLQICSVDGLTIDTVETCHYGCDSASATCLAAACQEGELRCAPGSPLAVERCNDAQTAFEPTDVTCTEECVDGQCHVSACQPGEQRCGGSGIETCTSAGTGFALTEECTWGCLSSGAEAMCATCLPGAYACLDNSVVFCEAPVLPWTLVKECKEVDTCAGGQCVKVLTLEGSPGANSVLLKLVEGLADCWLQMKGQDKKDDVCRGLHTPGLEGDIERQEVIDWFCDNAGESIQKDDFSEKDHYAAAEEVLGCGLLSWNNLTVNTPGEKIHAGLSQVECIGHEKNEVIVAPCDTFGD